jgi:hypothetical protein
MSGSITGEQMILGSCPGVREWDFAYGRITSANARTSFLPDQGRGRPAA